VPPRAYEVLQCYIARLYEIAIQGATKGATKRNTRCYIFKNSRKPENLHFDVDSPMSNERQPQFHRLFVALPVSDSVKSEIRKSQHELQQALPDSSVRWVRPEHLHLTLRFLGNVLAEGAPELAETLRIACQQFGPLRLRAVGIGFFPKRGYPRVIWTSIPNQAQQLTLLQSAVQQVTQKFTSEPPEKEFANHITLGRSKNIDHVETATLANYAYKWRERSFGEWTADSVELLRSELLPDGAHHTVVKTIPLAGAR